MPYERKGKCVYNKETGKSMGCYKSITKAKSRFQALYAAEDGSLKEEKTKKPSDAVLDRSEDIYQAMKATNLKSFVKKYGKEAENVMRGAAMKRAKDQVMTTNEEKLKEIIKSKLSINPLDKMKEKKLEALQDEPQNISEEEIIYEEEAEYEGEAAKAELYHIMENVKDLINLIEDDMQLESWVQSKIAKSSAYIDSVAQYFKYQHSSEQPVFEKTEYYLKK